MRYNKELNANLRQVRKSGDNCNADLFRRLVHGENVREQMIVDNMPLALSIVDTYLRAFPDAAHLQDDLTAACFLGIVEAVDKLSKRSPNSTILRLPADESERVVSRYIGKSIEFRLRNAIYDAPLIRVPRKRTEKPPTVVSEKDTSKMLMGARETTIECIDLRDLIDACCESDIDRELISLREQGYTQREIAAQLGIGRATEQRIVYAIRARVEKSLEKTRE